MEAQPTPIELWQLFERWMQAVELADEEDAWAHLDRVQDKLENLMAQFVQETVRKIAVGEPGDE